MPRPKNINPKIAVRKEGSAWVCQWYANGKTVRRGCYGATTEAQAREIAKRRFEEWRNPPPPSTWTVRELLDAYVDYKTKDGPQHERTRSPTFAYNLAPIRGYFGAYTVAQLGPDAWNDYRAMRTRMTIGNAGARIAAKNGRALRTVSDATAVRELNGLRGALNWARARKWGGLETFDTDVAMRLMNPLTNPRGEYLTRDELRRLLAAVSETPHLDLFCRLGVATGARMSALLGLTWDHVSWAGIGHALSLHATARIDEANIEDIGDDIEINFGSAIGNKKKPSGLVSRTNVNLWQALVSAAVERERRKQAGKPTCENVISYHGKPIKSVDLSDAFERANIPQRKRTQHVLKHTCCSWLVQAGHSYTEIAALVGTSAATIERFYGHLDKKRIARVGSTLNV